MSTYVSLKKSSLLVLQLLKFHHLNEAFPKLVPNSTAWYPRKSLLSSSWHHDDTFLSHDNPKLIALFKVYTQHPSYHNDTSILVQDKQLKTYKHAILNVNKFTSHMLYKLEYMKLWRAAYDPADRQPVGVYFTPTDRQPSWGCTPAPLYSPCI
jgi:hypothetical protein